MITLPIFILSIFLVPVAGITIAFRYFFPKHAIKVSDSYLLTMGSSLTILVNIPILFLIFKNVVPSSVFLHTTDLYDEVLRSLNSTSFCAFLFFIGLVSVVPILISTLFFERLKNYFWQFYCSNLETDFQAFTEWQQLRFKIGESVSTSILNYMANLTIHAKGEEILLVDVLDDQDSLYSGIYTDFFMEDGRFAGISIASVIRYSFKNEKERKANHPQTGTDKSVQDRKEKPYILPRNGEMFFPSDKIHNLHIWKVKKGHVFEKEIDGDFDEAILVWFLLVQNSFKRMAIKVLAHPTANHSGNWNVLTKALENFNIDLQSLEVISPTKKDEI